MKDNETILDNKEERLLFGNEDQFGIYQLKRDEALRDYRFESTDRLKIAGLEVDKWNYELNYVGKMEENITLDDIYMKFNVDRPEDFTGHSWVCQVKCVSLIFQPLALLAAV